MIVGGLTCDRTFQSKDENNGISKSTVIRTVQRFKQMGFVNRQGRPAITTNPDKRLNVLQSFIEYPRNSIRKVAQQHDIDPTSVHKILKKEKFHLYKIHLAQELYEDDFDHCIEFCKNDIIDRQEDWITILGTIKDLTALCDEFREGRPSMSVVAFLSSKNVELMIHCPYSPDLSPNDFFLFPNIKKKMRDERFELSEAAVEIFRTLISEVTASEWKKCFENWFQRTQKCIDLKGEYFEKQ
ncbi:SETMR methyltransferase, partial [Pseudoatta argentina]